jgi:hypothetical protein
MSYIASQNLVNCVNVLISYICDLWVVNIKPVADIFLIVCTGDRLHTNLSSFATFLLVLVVVLK